MNNSDIKDKAIFIIGFLAIFLSLSTFKDPLSRIIVPLPTIAPTIWNLVEILVGMLIVSVYLYALSYTQSSFGKYQNNVIVRILYKVILLLANFFYSFGLFLPLFLILTSLFDSSPLYPLVKAHQTGIIIFDTVLGIILAILAALNAFFGENKEKGSKISL